MSILPSVPAQEDAVAYLHAVSGSGPEVLRRVGGHSKGGNLAVYAAVYSPPEIQDRIIEVYNNDGPGFGKSILKQENYQRIRSKIRTIIPQSSIVGMLLEHEEEYEVVKSRRIGPLQHDAFNWEVSGSGFVHLASITAGCRYFDRTIKAWTDGLNEIQRRQFIEALFTVLNSTGAKTLTELTKSKMKKANIMIKTFNHLDKDTRYILNRTIRLLFKESVQLSRLRD
jgi:hypothetical protein